MLSLQLWRDWVLLCAKQKFLYSAVPTEMALQRVFQKSMFYTFCSYPYLILVLLLGLRLRIHAKVHQDIWLLLLKGGQVTSGAKKHWSYNGNQGTDHTCIRGKCLSIFSLCRNFRLQNGIDVESFKEFLRKNRTCCSWRCCVIEHNFLPIALLM